jgi:hypothetical protein
VTLLFAAALLAGVLLGYLRGGRLRRVQGLSVRFPGLLLAATALQAALRYTSRGARSGGGVTLLLLSYFLVAAWIFVNSIAWHGLLRAGVGVVAVGWALNIVAIVPNGTMPVSAAAADRAIRGTGTASTNIDIAKHGATKDSSMIRWLGDIVPLSELRVVVSIGDAFLLCGVGLIVAGAMRSQESDAVVASAPV